MIDVDGEVGPGLTLDFGRSFGGAAGQVANMAETGADDIIVVEEPGDCVGLGSGLDDDECFPVA